MKSPNLKKCVQQHINSSNLTSQLRAVSHGKNPFQTTHELIPLSHAFNYLLFRERNKLSSLTTGVNQTQVDSFQVCAFQCHSLPTVSLLCFEQDDKVPQQHHCKTAQILPAELGLKVSKHVILPL